MKAYGDPNTPVEKLTDEQKDNRNIIRTVTNKYAQLLTVDEINDCALEAIWRCLGYHRDDKGQKFTTSLWKFTDWECKRQLRKKRKSVNTPNTLSIMDFDHFDLPAPEVSDDIAFIRECVDLLPEPHRQFIKEYYFQNLTMEQIGQKYNFSKEAARQKINKALKRLHEIYIDKSETVYV